MAASNPRVKFLLGLMLIICGWIICFDLFLLIIGIPFFLTGALLVVVSNKSRLVKILAIGIPIVLWFTGFELILHALKQKQKLDIYLPYDYKGQFRIVYGESKGETPAETGGRMQLYIPQNGMLIIQPFLKSGEADFGFYYVDGKGMNHRISEAKDANDEVKRPAVLFEGTRSGKYKPVSPKDTVQNTEYVYNSFYVLQNDSMQAENFVEEQRYNALNDSLVKSRRLR